MASRCSLDSPSSSPAVSIAVTAPSVRSSSRSSTRSTRLQHSLSPPMRAAQMLGVLAAGPIVAVDLRAHGPLAPSAARVCWLRPGSWPPSARVWALVQRSRPGTTICRCDRAWGYAGRRSLVRLGHVVLLTGLAWVATPYFRGLWRILPWAIVIAGLVCPDLPGGTRPARCHRRRGSRSDRRRRCELARGRRH